MKEFHAHVNAALNENGPNTIPDEGRSPDETGPDLHRHGQKAIISILLSTKSWFTLQVLFAVPYKMRLIGSFYLIMMCKWFICLVYFIK